MPKSKGNRPMGRATRLDPLGQQLEKDAERRYAKERRHTRAKATRREAQAQEDEDAEGVVPKDMSRKILSFAREQVEADKAERNKEAPSDGRGVDEDEDDDEAEEEEEEEYEIEYVNEDQYADLGVDAADERALQAFMNQNKPERRNLADIIMEKIAQREHAAAQRAASKLRAAEDTGPSEPSLNQELVTVYQSIGKLLARYRAGKVPKAFKIIPALVNWEETLYHTHPENWSPQAMRAATRLFASNLNQKMAQRFYATVLLPAVRDDVAENKKLNYHLYMSLKKAMYRPGAFFKGVLLPLCEGGDCTLREAAIIGSVLAKVSIPMMHSAAAMLKMASMPYSGATSLFLRVLLNKKYSLPYKVIDALVVHFVNFRRETRELPVLWHQSLLVFAQRYKTTLTQEQKDFMKPLLKQHYHHQITPEIRRELFFSVSRGDAAAKS